MTATAQNRGHEIRHKNGAWVDGKTRQPYSGRVPCAKCGEFPTAEGYDACLVKMLSAINALTGVRTTESCCGHGTRPMWIWCECEDTGAVEALAKYANLHFDRLTVEYNWTHEKLVYVLERDASNTRITNSYND